MFLRAFDPFVAGRTVVTTEGECRSALVWMVPYRR